MVFTTCIILELPFFILLFIGSVCWTSCVDVWQNMSPGEYVSPHCFGGGSHNETAQSVFDLYQCFLVSSTRGIVGRFLLIQLSECLCILFEIGLSRAFAVTSIVALISAVIANNVIHIFLGLC